MMISIKKITGCLPPVFTTYTNAYVPHVAEVALVQDEFTTVKPIVQIGDRVREGQVIARDIHNMCNVHASVPGLITEFIETPLPNGKAGQAVSIKLDGRFSFLGRPVKKEKWDFLSSEQLVRIIADKGIVNTFHVPFPLSVQLLNVTRRNCDRNIILRLYDTDPTCCTDSYVTEKHLPEIIEGIAIISAILNPTAVFCLYNKTTNLKDSGAALHSLFNAVPLHFVPVDITKYPCGGAHEVVHAAKHYAKGIGSVAVSKHDLLIDSVTAYAVYQAVILDMPVMSQYVFVGGDALGEQKMFKARIGTPIYELFEDCGGLVEKPGKILINGTICGNAISNFSTPVTKYTKSVTVLSERSALAPHISDCIRCGKCRQVCPAGLHPDKLYARYMKKILIPNSDIETTLLCSACRLCNMTCPSRLPLFQTVNQIQKIAERQYEK